MGEEVSEVKMGYAFVVALCEEWGHGDDVFWIVIPDVLEPSEFALARFFVIDEIGSLNILGLMGSGTYEINLTDSELTHLHAIT